VTQGQSIDHDVDARPLDGAAPEVGADTADAATAPASSSAPPPPHGMRSVAHRFLTQRSVSIAVVAVIAGLLFATNAALFRSSGDREAQNLSDLVQEEEVRVEKITREVEALRADVDRLVEAASAGEPPAEGGMTGTTAAAAGRVAVAGPGVLVKLWDAPTSNAPPGARPDDLLVHQQDVEAVVNALWAGGAEAMTIQGQRVTSKTAVRCVGNVLLLHGATYSPPYEIAAIGDSSELLDSLYSSPGVRVYLEYVDAVGLGWSAARAPALDMPAADSITGLSYATVPDEALLAVLQASGTAVAAGSGPGPEDE
jgi:uncharacterized protein YlxW (UPF0749 family)